MFSEQNPNFDTDDCYNEVDDEEIDDEVLDELVAAIGEEIFKEDQNPSILNLKRVRQIAAVFNALKKSIGGENVTIACNLHQPLISSAYISVCAVELVFNNTKCFSEIAKYASNIEIYPKTDGTTQMNIMFYGLTAPICIDEEE